MNSICSELCNLNMYGPFTPIATGEPFILSVTDINKDNWNSYYQSILNILKDAIYTDYLHEYQVNVVFADGNDVDLSVMDLYFNIIMWRLLIWTNTPIMCYHIFYDDEFTAKTIKKYIDKFFISENRTKMSNIALSNIISDTLHFFHDIDIFSLYLSNTLNLEDSIELMNKDPEFYECLHADLSNIPIDKVSDLGMEYTDRSIRSIKKAKPLLGHDHCLADAWRAKEGIKPKQYMEVTIGIGTKPDGRGGIFNSIVNTSFINGGVTDPINYYIESSVSRISQIIKHKSVSNSGSFARIVGLNNMDTFLYPDSNYDCHSNHLIPIIIRSDEHLKYLNLRYFREYPMGIERCLDYEKDKYLIGKTIYLRDPCTCISAANGKGVCYKCYGQLAYSVYDSEYHMGVNIGRIAGELITSILTQKQLSVKHLIESNVSKIEWTEAFDTFFEMDVDSIQISKQFSDMKDYFISINPDNIEIENEADDSGIDDDEVIAALWLNEYITEFDVIDNDGNVYTITTASEEKLYITNELNEIIRKKAEPVDGRILIKFNEIKDNVIFIIQAQNNEITRSLEKIKHLYNKSDHVKDKTITELLQQIIDTNVEVGLEIADIHYSILLMNQIRSDENIIEKPNWGMVNPTYRILTLNESLMNNPSVLISLSYQKITTSFYTPLTYKKTKPSFIDLFFMQRPQRIIRGIDDMNVERKRDPGEKFSPIIFYEPDNKITGDNYDEDDNDMSFYDDDD